MNNITTTADAIAAYAVVIDVTTTAVAVRAVPADRGRVGSSAVHLVMGPVAPVMSPFNATSTLSMLLCIRDFCVAFASFWYAAARSCSRARSPTTACGDRPRTCFEVRLPSKLGLQHNMEHQSMRKRAMQAGDGLETKLLPYINAAAAAAAAIL